MSYVNAVGAYSRSQAIIPVRANPDYVAARQAEKAPQPDQARSGFGPAARVTLSPEAQAYLQSQKTSEGQGADPQADQAKADQVRADQARAAEARRTEDAEAQAEEAKRAQQAETPQA